MTKIFDLKFGNSYQFPVSSFQGVRSKGLIHETPTELKYYSRSHWRIYRFSKLKPLHNMAFLLPYTPHQFKFPLYKPLNHSRYNLPNQPLLLFQIIPSLTVDPKTESGEHLLVEAMLFPKTPSFVGKRKNLGMITHQRNGAELSPKSSQTQ